LEKENLTSATNKGLFAFIFAVGNETMRGVSFQQYGKYNYDAMEVT